MSSQQPDPAPELDLDALERRRRSARFSPLPPWSYYPEDDEMLRLIALARRLLAERDALVAAGRVLAALVRAEYPAGLSLGDIAATWTPMFAEPRYTDADVALLRRVEGLLGDAEG